MFGYGSLVAVAHDDARAVELHGLQRRWGVAMDNRRRIPGYKRYLLPDGSQPALHVAFLDLLPGTGAVNGVCRPVTAAQLAALDRRERNYVRRDVTARIAGMDEPQNRGPARVWAYVGSPAGRARLEAGRRTGTAAVSRAYLDAVLAGFARLGRDQLTRFHASSDLGDLPLHELRRDDLG